MASTFGERLAVLREEKSLSQAELAKRLTIAKSTLAMYETDKREPGFEIVQRIADFFDVYIDFLIKGQGPKYRTDLPTQKDENIFFYEWDKLTEEDKEKALAHIKFLQHMAEQENKKK